MAQTHRLRDLGGRILSAGDTVALPTVTGWGQYKSAILKAFTVEKLGRTKVTLAGRATAIDPNRVVKLGPAEHDA